MVRLADFGVTFGTSGARGLVEDLSDAYCWAFTAAFLDVLGNDAKGLIVGHDLRPSSPRIAASCIAAARHRGVDCIFAGVLPTPALALAGESLGLPAIMVTGSHIPADRNGLKAYRACGEINKADEQEMLAAVVELPADLSSSISTLPGAVRQFIESYRDRYLSAFGPDALRGLRIGVYEHSSAARDLFHDVLRGLGASTVALGRSEIFVPVDTEAIRQEDCAAARAWAASRRYDAIVSADGDADRPLIADETGTWLRGDVIGLLCSRALGAKTVVTPVNSSSAIEASGVFESVIRTKIGSPYVISGMRAPGLATPVTGFEANGGFLLGSSVTIGRQTLAALMTRDAMLPVIATLADARRRRLSVSGLVAELPARFTHSDRISNFPVERSRALLQRIDMDREFLRVLMAPDSDDVSAINRTDGIRVTFGDGRIVHLRPSGNAPELRCYTECSAQEDAEILCTACLARVLTIS